ncbi:polysaccharide deacetylase family protein [Hirschia baltica]|uniref:Chitooligosaccharide deacetylase n=1 Tax=Hirschia baltica (strain ATCC 49814 / DSM 5838 / IFAM 1418) TaxID=582402 RepID=C6XKT2_HIRBI|nr:polysaccharide deacetylase family protein [Hirschia baltica]ACT59649.1 polysaccharide deacetylase [Hirschia baltica ATCC 49814]
MIDWHYTPSRTLPAKLKRRMTQWRHAAPVDVSNTQFHVSYTFDDFPMSAVNGADILESHDGHAAFYACTKMIGTHGAYGDMYDIKTMLDLENRGHEIGAHTHSHLDCAQSKRETVLNDIDANISALMEAGLKKRPTSFAYPYGETLFDTKKEVFKKFDLCRGILPGINVGKVDLAQLRCFELNENPATRIRAINAIEEAGKTGGWVIIFTHDVSPQPTAYGTTTGIVEELCQLSKAAGATLSTPTEAARSYGLIS